MTTISVLEYLSLIGTMISIDRPHLTPTSGLEYMEGGSHPPQSFIQVVYLIYDGNNFLQ